MGDYVGPDFKDQVSFDESDDGIDVALRGAGGISMALGTIVGVLFPPALFIGTGVFFGFLVADGVYKYK
jgi:hypothetical protein